MAKKTKMPTDVNQRAKAIVDFDTGTADRTIACRRPHRE